MNKHDEIKNLLKASRNLIYQHDKNLMEDIRKIKKRYGIITEDIKFKEEPTGDDNVDRVNVPTSVESEIDFDVESKEDKQQSYRFSGGILTMHGKNQKELQITTLDKQSFQDTMDEFVQEVSDMADFKPLNVYSDSVEWSGKLIEFNIDFMFRIGETNGIYINSQMVKVDQEFDNLIEKLRQFYEKFKSKWAKVVAQRKRTEPTNES